MNGIPMSNRLSDPLKRAENHRRINSLNLVLTVQSNPNANEAVQPKTKGTCVFLYTCELIIIHLEFYGIFNRSPSTKAANSPRVSFSSPRGSKRKATDVLDDLQYSASEKEDEEDEDDDDEELEEVAMDVDVDANYDPEAEFFSCGPSKDEDIRDDLQVSESEEEGEIRDDDQQQQPVATSTHNKGRSRHHSNRPSSSRDEDDDGGLWF